MKKIYLLSLYLFLFFLMIETDSKLLLIKQ